MRVAIIGSGNVAEAFALAVDASRLYLAGVAGRNLQRVKHLASISHCEQYILPNIPQAELYIVAVGDDALSDVLHQIDFGGAVVAHTAGSVSIDSLSSIENRAVLYPLQTFSKGCKVNFCEIPLFIEGSTELALDVVRSVASVLSDRVVELDSEGRRRVHLAAIFACNFVNAMYVQSEAIMRNSGFDFALLAPLIEQTSRKAIESGNPSSVQTGPAVRGDRATMNAHINMLESEKMKQFYITISDIIWQTSKKI